jgi:hypothetical protein
MNWRTCKNLDGVFLGYAVEYSKIHYCVTFRNLDANNPLQGLNDTSVSSPLLSLRAVMPALSFFYAK